MKIGHCTLPVNIEGTHRFVHIALDITNADNQWRREADVQLLCKAPLSPKSRIGSARGLFVVHGLGYSLAILSLSLESWMKVG